MNLLNFFPKHSQMIEKNKEYIQRKNLLQKNRIRYFDN